MTGQWIFGTFYDHLNLSIFPGMQKAIKINQTGAGFFSFRADQPCFITDSFASYSYVETKK
jgi:hypothetical protein